MTSLGEMATYMPVSGSFATYASKYVDPAFGFAMGGTTGSTGRLRSPWILVRLR